MTERKEQTSRYERKNSNRKGALQRYKPDPFIMKSIICIILFLFVLAIRASDSQYAIKIRETINCYIGNGADYVQVIKFIGKAVADKESITEVIGDESIRVFGIDLIVPKSDEDEAEIIDQQSNNSNIDDMSEQIEQTDTIVHEYGEEDEPVDESYYQQQNLVAKPTALSVDLLRQNQQPYVISSSLALASLSILNEEVIDNTPATEFEIPAPDRVDMTVDTLPFKFTSPIKGEITSGFGYRDHPVTNKVTFHYGVDIGADLGDKICSFAKGTVTEIGTSAINGKYVIVTHSDGFWTRYCHLNKITVKKGQKVKIGDKLGEAGNTGMSTGVHLHFEIRLNDSVLNPTQYVSFS